ncbi:Checkpoint kinase 2 [Actinomortierella ambigua]|nr:Checkpoint kinase 2 [Actinomortierella ambigua]
MSIPRSRGSFATVKLAIHCKTRTQLAVKIMDLGKFSEPKQSGETDYRQEVALLRKLKHPENVLLTSPAQFPRVILTDFGMARELKNSEPLMAMCGTYAYMAPEVFDVKHAGGTGYRTSADCWSFGVLLYVIMSAMHPFARGKHKDDELVVMQRVKANHLLVREPSGRWTARDVLASPWIQHDLRWLRGEYKEIVIENWQRQLRILENIRQSPRHNGPEQIVPLSASPTPSSSSVKLASNEESCLSEDTISTSGTSYSSTLASAESVYDPTIASTTDSTICAPKRSFDANHSSGKFSRSYAADIFFVTESSISMYQLLNLLRTHSRSAP